MSPPHAGPPLTQSSQYVGVTDPKGRVRPAPSSYPPYRNGHPVTQCYLLVVSGGT